jgi:NAD(P)-dependent dehydrogenase (short-subunit alcohol dehydrogenase family)
MNQGKKIAIVTGANRGIGLEIARQLVEKKFSVIIAARNEQKGKEAAEKIGASFMKLDVADEKNILEFTDELKQKSVKVDVLINNAGIIEKGDSDMLTATSSMIYSTLATNAIGPFLLSQAVSTLMNKGGRIIMISSGGGSMSDEVGGWSPVYCTSKTLLNSFTRQLAYFLQSREISVNAVCPGWVRTDMGGRSAPRHVSEGADTPVWLATKDKIPSGKFFRDRKEIPF